jgi:hypothetical protein
MIETMRIEEHAPRVLERYTGLVKIASRFRELFTSDMCNSRFLLDSSLR